MTNTPILAVGLTLAALLLLDAPARADIIHYRDGRTLEGVIVERSDTAIKVETDFGTLDIPLSKVARIEERLTPAQELAAQRATVAADDAAALYQLARWASDHKLRREARELLHEVLAADPDHAGAQTDLGRVLVEGRWMEPEDVEAWLAEVAAEREAQGLLLYEGEWLPEAEVMARRGLVLLDGRWVPRREAETRGALTALAEQAGWSTRATEGEHVTVYGDLDEDSLEYLIYDLDAMVTHFLGLVEMSDEERQRVAGREVAIYLPPDLETAAALVESPFLERYPLFAGSRERWTGQHAFGMNWPVPFLVLAGGPHLEVNGDADEARTGLLAHMMGRLLIDRFKGDRTAPGWAQHGLTAWYEGAANYHSTFSITSTGFDSEGELTGGWVDGWGTFPQIRDALLEESTHGNLPSLARLLGDAPESFDSRDVGMAWSFTRFLLERHRGEFFGYLRGFDSNPFEVATDLKREHERAWAAHFAEPVEDVVAEWRDWCLTRPRRFPVDELDR